MKNKCVNSVKLTFAYAQHLRLGRRAHQHHQRLPILVTSDQQIPELVTDKSLQQLHLPVQTPSDEEADQEVEAICRPSEYYRVRSQEHRRHHFFFYV